jgi:hypothetical protein
LIRHGREIRAMLCNAGASEQQNLASSLSIRLAHVRISLDLGGCNFRDRRSSGARSSTTLRPLRAAMLTTANPSETAPAARPNIRLNARLKADSESYPVCDAISVTLPFVRVSRLAPSCKRQRIKQWIGGSPRK